MTNITLAENGNCHRLVFYLAMEEFVAANLESVLASSDSREAFFLWQVEPTVIFGRNQVMEAEVNIPYCREHGIRLFRRKSGGGCVYSDKGNIMLSFISSCTDVESTFAHFLSRVVEALRNMGLPAERSGRNDILIDGKKVSGNSFFMLPKAGIVHGTMLFDSDFDALVKAITPSAAKISSKGVDSVRRHVTNLRPILESVNPSLAHIETFKRRLTEEFCGSEQIVLNEEQIAEIKRIEATYLEPEFISGRKHSYTLSREGRNGAGDFHIDVNMDGGVIGECNVSGDWFALKDGLSEALSAALKGCPDERDAVGAALKDFDAGLYVRGLDTAGLLELLCGPEISGIGNNDN